MGAPDEEAVLRGVLVTDAGVPAALTAIRSLGRAGFPVIAVGRHRLDPGLLSRHARVRRVLPDAAVDSEGFLARLTMLLVEFGNPVVLPVTDLSLTILDRHRGALPVEARRALPPREALSVVLDRETTLRTARRLGISFPRTHLASNETEVTVAARNLRFPAVVKPRRSRWFTPDGRIDGGTASYAATALDAAQAIRRLGPAAGAALVQEYHEGEGRGIFLLMRDGEPVARFAHRRVLSRHPEGGASARAAAVAAEGDALEAAVTLLRDIRWEGPAMVEFLRPADGGSDLLMEVNGRLWGSLACAVAAGVDFPALWVRGLLGVDARGPARYTIGTQVRHVLGEAIHAVRVLRGPPPGYAGTWPGRRSVARLLLPASAPRVAHQVASVDDPLPFVGEVLGAVIGRRG